MTFRWQVGKLLALKGEYKTLTGEDVPGSKPKKEKKKKKEAAPKEAKKPKPAKAKKVTEPVPAAKTVKAKEAKAQKPQIVQAPTTTGPLQINVVDGAPAWSVPPAKRCCLVRCFLLRRRVLRWDCWSCLC